MRTALIFLFVSSLAQAYDLKRDRDGDIVRWSGALHFTIQSDLDDALHAPGATAAVQAAIATWASAMPNMQIRATQGEVKDSDSGITVIEHDWPYDADVFAVTILKVDYVNNRIVEADIYINGAQNKFQVLDPMSQRGGQFADVQNAITHEVGHAIGLLHEKERLDAVMYPLAYNGEVNKRALSSDDIEGLDALYPLTPQQGPQLGCSASGAAAPLALALVLLALQRRVPAPRRAR